jgi:hypothetical protein
MFPIPRLEDDLTLKNPKWQFVCFNRTWKLLTICGGSLICQNNL